MYNRLLPPTRKFLFRLLLSTFLLSTIVFCFAPSLHAQILNYIPKWGNSGSSVPSQFFDDGVNVGLNTANPTQKFDVVGGNIRTDGWFISTVATGTAPLMVNSNTLVSNLNSDMLDGLHYSAFALDAHSHSGMLTNTGTGTATQVAFWNSADKLGGSNALFWDNVKERLGVGIITPQSKLHIHSGEMVTGSNTGGNHPKFFEEDVPADDSLSKSGNNIIIIDPPPYALTTFQITNNATDKLSTDGFIISLKDNDAYINLQESGDIRFTANKKQMMTLFKEGVVGIGTSTKDAKLNIYSLASNGLTVSSFNNPS